MLHRGVSLEGMPLGGEASWRQLKGSPDMLATENLLPLLVALSGFVITALIALFVVPRTNAALVPQSIEECNKDEDNLDHETLNIVIGKAGEDMLAHSTEGGVDGDVFGLQLTAASGSHLPQLPCLSIWALTTTNLAYGFTIAAQGLFVAPLEVERLWPDTESFALSGIVVAVAVAQLIGPAAGYYSDHYESPLGRRRPLLILSIGMTTSLTMASWAFSKNLWRQPFFAAFFFQQIFLTIVLTSQQGLISDIVPDTQRGFVGAAAAVNFLIGAISAFVCMEVLRDWEYHAVYAIIVILLLASSSLVCYTGSEASSVGHNSFSFSGLVASFSFDFRKNKDFSLLLATKLLYYATVAVKSFLLFYVRDTFAITDAAQTKSIISQLSVFAELAAAVAALVALYCLRGGGQGSEANRTSSVLKWSIGFIRVGSIWMGIAWLGPAVLAHVVQKFFASNPGVAHGAELWKAEMLYGTTAWGVGQGLYLAADQALQYMLLPDREEASRHLGFASICTFVGTSAGGLIASGLLSTFGGAMTSGYSSAGYMAVFVFTSATCFALAGITLFIRSK